MNPRLRYILVGLVVLLLLALGAWYLFISGRIGALRDIGEGRGLGSAIPSFTGPSGSTFENLVSGLGFQSAPAVEGPQAPPRLWRVQSTPVAGHGFLQSTTTESVVRFMERSTGYLFDADTVTGAVERRTNTLVPRVYEAFFSPNGSVIARTLSEGELAQTTAATVVQGTSTELADLSELSLGEDVFAVLPSIQEEIFVSLVSDGAFHALIRSGWDGSDPERIARLALRNWHMSWLEDNSIVIAQSPASGLSGSAYRLFPDGTQALLARNVPGLTIAAHPSSGAVLIGSDSGLLTLSAKLDGAPPTPLSLRTTAEKCVWAPGDDLIAYCAAPGTIQSNRFLDDWHQGKVHTSDTWWKVNARDGTTEFLLSPESELNILIDVERPIMNAAGTHISFMNARDKSLWVLRVEDSE
jgi:hypothetical protein